MWTLEIDLTEKQFMKLEMTDDTLTFKKHSLKIVTAFMNTSYNLEIS